MINSSMSFASSLLKLLSVALFLNLNSVSGECPPAETIQKDVVIIGAGMAGLSAGKTLLEDWEPLDFVILESQLGRVGGRVRSNSDWFPGFTVEEGANWLSDNTQNPALAFARDYGVEMFNQDFGNYNLYEYDNTGAKIADGQEAHFSSQKNWQAYQCIQKEAAKLLKPNGNFKYNPLTDGVQAVQANRCGWSEDNSLDYFHDWLTHGSEFAEKDTSMFSYPNRRYFIAKFFLIMDQYGGFEKLPKSFAAEFLGCTWDGNCWDSPYFWFDQRVERVYYNAGGDYPVLVETNFFEGCPTYRFEAKRVISTLGEGVMKSGAVEFVPPLPYPSPFKMADYVKVFYQFSSKFWVENDDNQFITTIPSDYNEILATQGRCIYWQSLDYSTGINQGPKQTSPHIAPGSNIIFCTLLTEAFQQLLAEAGNDDELAYEQLTGTMLDPLKKVYGDEILDLLVHVDYPKLNKDPNFMGSYENWQVGYDLVDYYHYHGGILPGSNPLVGRCEHNGCTEPGSNGNWTLHVSGTRSCQAYYGFVRGAMDGGARSANYVRADIGCGGNGCADVSIDSVCDDLYVNNGQGK